MFPLNALNVPIHDAKSIIIYVHVYSRDIGTYQDDVSTSPHAAATAGRYALFLMSITISHAVNPAIITALIMYICCILKNIISGLTTAMLPCQ